MIPLEKVKNIIEKHSRLESELSSTNIDKKKFVEMSKEYADLNEIIHEQWSDWGSLSDVMNSFRLFISLDKVKSICDINPAL